MFPATAPDLATWPAVNASRFAVPWVRARALALATAVVVALAFRTAGLATYGFNEDEINKVHAIAGRVHTGVLSADALASIVRALPPGVTELMVHPGYHDADLERSSTRLLESRQQELDLLCKLETRAVLVGERVDLVRHDLTHVIKGSLRHVS